MQALTSYERVCNTLGRRPVDRLAVALSPWGETLTRWRSEGHLRIDEDYRDHFDLDTRQAGWLNSVADVEFKNLTVEEDEDTVLALDGNGARLRWYKKHETTPEHVGFSVTDRAGWEAQIKPHLIGIDRRRVPFEDYRKASEAAARDSRFFLWAGVAPFEQMHPVVGHEAMLLGMAVDPDWVRDMVMTYARFTVMHLEALFAESGKPDALFFYEDMGFKQKPFISLAMYREIVMPGHKLLFDYAHSLGCKVIVHSCGYVEPLLPGFIEAGMDCLQAMEVKAGMDLARLAGLFGDRISFYGGLDVRTLISNDREAIDAEMRAKIPAVLAAGAGYIVHSDHSEPPEVDYETARFFLERGREFR